MTPLPENRPVGFFDSGLGGLCILNAFKELFPAESTVYVADRANCPYGNKTSGEITRLSERIVRFLIDVHNVKMIVVACNTATAASIDFLRREYPQIPFIGIEPAIKPAVLHSKTGIVGVLATKGTFDGRLYKETSARFAGKTNIVMSVADEFVALVESGKTDGPEADETVERIIRPLIERGCDHIVLGCTHFPHLIGAIKKAAAGKAEIIEPSYPVAKHAGNVLRQLGVVSASQSPTHVFIDTSIVEIP